MYHCTVVGFWQITILIFFLDQMLWWLWQWLWLFIYIATCFNNFFSSQFVCISLPSFSVKKINKILWWWLWPNCECSLSVFLSYDILSLSIAPERCPNQQWFFSLGFIIINWTNWLLFTVIFLNLHNCSTGMGQMSTKKQSWSFFRKPIWSASMLSSGNNLETLNLSWKKRKSRDA